MEESLVNHVLSFLRVGRGNISGRQASLVCLPLKYRKKHQSVAVKLLSNLMNLLQGERERRPATDFRSKIVSDLGRSSGIHFGVYKAIHIPSEPHKKGLCC